MTGKDAGIGFWPMAQQYRHIIPGNPQKLACNHNLFDVHTLELTGIAQGALMPILNSTFIALTKQFYARFAGTEGNLKTEVVDVMLLEIPDPRRANASVLKQMDEALEGLQNRRITHLVEQTLMDCHTAAEVREAAMMPIMLPEELRQSDRQHLDDAVLQLLGVC